MRTLSDYNKVIAYINDKISITKISKLTSIPRATIRDWLKLGFHPKKDRYKIDDTYWSFDNKMAYSYILGQYLGDGYIVKVKSTWRLRIFNTRKYINISDEIVKNLKLLFPNNVVKTIENKDSNVTIILVNSNTLPNLFPQIGVGRKHERDIILSDWQLSIISEFSDLFLRGLFHSDGCRYVRNHEKQYVTYTFVNKSTDIIDIAKQMLSYRDIQYSVYTRQDGVITISISRKRYTDLLDSIVGPKT